MIALPGGPRPNTEAGLQVGPLVVPPTSPMGVAGKVAGGYAERNAEYVGRRVVLAGEREDQVAGEERQGEGRLEGREAA